MVSISDWETTCMELVAKTTPVSGNKVHSTNAFAMLKQV